MMKTPISEKNTNCDYKVKSAGVPERGGDYNPLHLPTLRPVL